MMNQITDNRMTCHAPASRGTASPDPLARAIDGTARVRLFGTTAYSKRQRRGGARNCPGYCCALHQFLPHHITSNDYEAVNASLHQRGRLSPSIGATPHLWIALGIPA